MRVLDADVLVLGAGLAGLRAAMSCLEADPGLRVLAVCRAAGPSGSSFANPNNALGMLVCLSDAERRDYLDYALSGVGGAFVDAALVRLQAEEGPDRFEDLKRLGLPFVRETDGALRRQGSCFAPQARRAFVFTGLAQAHAAFARRLKDLGLAFAPGLTVAGIVTGPDESGGRAVGALLTDEKEKPVLARAKVVVAALGGPARLFAHSLVPADVSGFSHALLARAGARLANTGYLQYLWGVRPGGRFWQPADLASGGFVLLTPSGERIDPVRHLSDLAALAASRAGHCPYGYALPDSALDLALARHMDDAGRVTLLGPTGERLVIAPMAHAANGGALIDEWAQTNVPGLLACGECATGMHGANRLGGAMVLATQAFGHRAGVRAAALAGEPTTVGEKATREAARILAAELVRDDDERRAGLKQLGLELARHAVLGGGPGFEAFKDRMLLARKSVKDWRLRLALETALTFKRVEEWPR